MFSLHPLSTPGRTNPFANAYRQINAETSVLEASPHRLVAMLFDAYMDALAQARGALRNGDLATKGRALGHAARIIDEGLRCCLDLQAGGTLASDLHDLYSYLAARLTLANLHNDENIIDECQRLVVPLREAWLEIGTHVEASQS